MYIGDFEELVRRNAYRPHDIRFYSSRWGRHNDAPAGTCTMIYGPQEDGVLMNVPIPDIPEYTLDRVYEDGVTRVSLRGWKGLLQMMLSERILRPSDEIRRLLGNRAFDKLKLGCA